MRKYRKSETLCSKTPILKSGSALRQVSIRSSICRNSLKFTQVSSSLTSTKCFHCKVSKLLWFVVKSSTWDFTEVRTKNINNAVTINYWHLHFSEKIWKPHVQQPPTVYFPSMQTDCLADFPRSVMMMMGVVFPERCQSYGIHLALPALWSRSSHHSSLVALV